MRGKPGTEIQITVFRKKTQKTIIFDITRQIIISKGIKSNIFENNIGYIRLASFQSNSTNDLKDEIYKLKKSSNNKLTGLILDLRNNPGGVLGSAVGVTDLFLQEGKIVYTKGRTANSQLEYFATPQDILDGLPLLIMVNEGSASASEIVAGALQDNKRATIVGEKSYGKASVQTIQELNDGSALKLTTARYYTPLGRNIHTQGISPDILLKGNDDKDEENKVSLPEPYDKDKQLFDAIAIIKGMHVSSMLNIAH
jgi:carboxyl-terminal processing protease